MSAGRVYSTITAYFDEAGWDYDAVGDGITVVCSFKGSKHSWRCLAQAVEGRTLALFYSLALDEVPPERRGEAAVLVTRANYGLLEGAFELDLDDGELRLRTSVGLDRLDDGAFGAKGLAASLFGGIVLANVFTMDSYLPAILAVAEGSSSAADAVAAVEGPKPES